MLKTKAKLSKTATQENSVELEIQIEMSSADSYIKSGYVLEDSNLEYGRDLTDDEIDFLNETITAEIQYYAYENGSRDHN